MYATFNDVVIRYPVVDKWSSNDTEVSSALLPYAEAELNGRLSKVYTVPFSGPPLIIKDLTIELTYLRLLRSRVEPKVYEAARKDIDIRINRLIEGDDVIITGSGTAIAPSTLTEEIWSSNEDYHPVHSMLDAEDAATQVSSERINDELTERGVSRRR